jgi:hypothetical protein
LKHRHPHLSGLTAYSKAHGEPIRDVKHVSCALCATPLVQSYERIRYHLSLKHRTLTVQEYYEKFVRGKVEEESGCSGAEPADSIVLEANPNREEDTGEEDEEERELNEYKDWVDKCQIRYATSSVLNQGCGSGLTSVRIRIQQFSSIQATVKQSL